MFAVIVTAVCLDSNVENFDLDVHDPATLGTDSQHNKRVTQKHWRPI
jgi:hypothetical protein